MLVESVESGQRGRRFSGSKSVPAAPEREEKVPRSSGSGTQRERSSNEGCVRNINERKNYVISQERESGSE